MLILSVQGRACQSKLITFGSWVGTVNRQSRLSCVSSRFLVLLSVIDTWVQRNISLYCKENKVKFNDKWQLRLILVLERPRGISETGKLKSEGPVQGSCSATHIQLIKSMWEYRLTVTRSSILKKSFRYFIFGGMQKFLNFEYQLSVFKNSVWIKKKRKE